MLLVGCSSVEYIEKPVKISPPEIYLEPTKFECKAKTGGDLWDCYLKSLDTVDKCNFDKEKIKEFHQYQ